MTAPDPGASDPLATDPVEERSLGRLFGLTDAVFAIAMTLLALDLKIPEGIGERPTAQVLFDALREGWPNYLSFLLSFYVIASYWRRHHLQMRCARGAEPILVRRTMTLLVAVCAMPFAAALLGNYGGANALPITVYSAVNVVAIIALLGIRKICPDDGRSDELWFNLVALVLAVPAALIFPGRGVAALFVLLGVAGITHRLYDERKARRARAAAQPKE